MQNEILEYWGQRFEVLNTRYDLIGTHHVSFMAFLASVSFNADNYRYLLIYLANPGGFASEPTLLEFLRCPHNYLALTLAQPVCVDAYPERDYWPLLPRQCQAALQMQFCEKSLSEFWEQRLERETMQLHGEQYVEPMPKRFYSKQPRRNYPYRPTKRVHA